MTHSIGTSRKNVWNCFQFFLFIFSGKLKDFFWILCVKVLKLLLIFFLKKVWTKTLKKIPDILLRPVERVISWFRGLKNPVIWPYCPNRIFFQLHTSFLDRGVDGTFWKKFQTFSSLVSAKQVTFGRILSSRIHEIAIFLNKKFQAHVFPTSNLILGTGYKRKILKKKYQMFL